jgi:hypothetical protein
MLCGRWCSSSVNAHSTERSSGSLTRPRSAASLPGTVSDFIRLTASGGLSEENAR